MRKGKFIANRLRLFYCWWSCLGMFCKSKCFSYRAMAIQILISRPCVAFSHSWREINIFFCLSLLYQLWVLCFIRDECYITHHFLLVHISYLSVNCTNNSLYLKEFAIFFYIYIVACAIQYSQNVIELNEWQLQNAEIKEEKLQVEKSFFL